MADSKLQQMKQDVKEKEKNKEKQDKKAKEKEKVKFALFKKFIS
jgi:hypothetical protein